MITIISFYFVDLGPVLLGANMGVRNILVQLYSRSGYFIKYLMIRPTACSVVPKAWCQPLVNHPKTRQFLLGFSYLLRQNLRHFRQQSEGFPSYHIVEEPQDPRAEASACLRTQKVSSGHLFCHTLQQN